MDQSQKYKLNTTDVKKIGKGMFYAGGGQAIVYLLTFLMNADFGKWTGLIGAGCSVLLLLVNKLLAGTPTETQPAE